MASQNQGNTTFGVALDIDGVLIQGPKLIPGAKEVLKKLQDTATKYDLFLSLLKFVFERSSNQQSGFPLFSSQTQAFQNH